MPRRLLPLLLAVALTTVGCTSASPEPKAKPAKPAAKPAAPPPLPGSLDRTFFGMHDSDPVGDSWPDAPVGALRVWDSGTVWSQMEASPGVYDFSRLDAIVETAREKKAEILIVLGQTPTFHAARPKHVGAYGPGAATMPDLDAWRAYVTAMVERYTGPDIAFQVWNEANVEGYWSGTPRQMARLTAVAREVIDAQPDPPTLVAPAMATRLISHRVYFRDFYAQKVRGTPVADLVDVLSFQLYPLFNEPLERSIDLLTAVRQLLALQDVDPEKPIWNTEINYGLQGGLEAEPIPVEEQAANVARTYVLNAANDVERVYWYSWDLQTIANTSLVAATGERSPAGAAFEQVERWLRSTVPQGCTVTREGTYACEFEAPEGDRWVYWNPLSQAVVRTAFEATSTEQVGSSASAVPFGSTTLDVDSRPLLVMSGRQVLLPPLE